MKVELTVALISGAIALASAGGSIWISTRTARNSDNNARAIEQLKIDNERLKAADQIRKETSTFSEPLARSAYDLQSRLYNILRQNVVEVYLIFGTERERSYIKNNTVFLIAQYLCWTEIVRREIQFIDLGEATKTRDLLRLQDDIYNIWGADRQSSVFRIFAGEQRALGEALIQAGVRGPECMGYGAFLKTFGNGTNPLIDAVGEDVLYLETGIEQSTDSGIDQATERLTNLQHSLIDLLKILDPDYIRFPENRRSKL